MDNQLPEGFSLDYTMPSTGEPVAPSIVSGVPDGFEINYTMPSDKYVRVPQEEVKQVAQDPVMQKTGVTIGGYISNRLSTMVGNIRKDYEESVRQSSLAIERGAKGKQTYAETALQVTGDTFNLLADALGETVIQIAGTAGDGISFIMPDGIEESIKQGAKDSWEYIINTPTGKAGMEALAGGMDSWLEFEKQNPRAAENIKSVVEIGMFVNPANTTTVKTVRNEVGGAVEKAGTIRRIKGIKQEVGKGTKVGSDIRYLDSMSNTKATGYMDRTRSIQTVVTDVEKEAVTALQGLRKYNPSATHQLPLAKNHRLVDEALIEAKAARDTILNNARGNVDVAKLFDDSMASLDDLVRNSPDAAALGKTTSAAMDEMERLINIHGTSVKGLDAVRKGMNDWEKLHSKIPQVDKAVAALRGQLRSVIDDTAPGYKAAQARVAGLTTAKIGIGNKLSVDAGNAFINYLDKALGTVGLTRDMAFLLTPLGIGYAASSMPILLGGGAIVGSLKLKGLVSKGLSPGAADKVLGTLQQITGDVIKASKGNAKVIKEIKAKQQAAVEVVKTAVENYKAGGVADEEVISTPYDEMSSEEFAAEQERLRMENSNPEVKPLEVEVTKDADMIQGIIDHNQVK